MTLRRFAWKFALPIAGILLIGLAVFNYIRLGRHEHVRLRCSGRNPCVAASRLAQRIVLDVRHVGLDLELVAATNSHEICAAVDEHRIDLGVIRGGFPAGEFGNIRQVAALGVEPMHLVVRGELVGDAVPTLGALKGRRVFLGEQGTNECELVEDLMRYAGFRFDLEEDELDIAPVYRREAEIREQIGRLAKASNSAPNPELAQLPDALFIGGSLPDPLVDTLVKRFGYRLVQLPFATALHLDQRREDGAVVNPLENSRIEPAKIPAYTYSAAPAEPPQSYETIGMRLLLVAHKDVPSSTIHLLLRALTEGAYHEYHDDLSVATTSAEFPLHPGALAYTTNRRPMSFNDALENGTNVLSVLGTFCAGSFALWSFLRGFRTVSPQHYLQQIDRIERLVRGVESEDAAPTAPIDLLVFLEARLAQLKQTVVDDYARGRLANDDALVSILTLIADTRNLLIQTHARLCRSDPLLARGDLLDAA